MKISDEEIQKMFIHAGVDRDRLHKVLIKMGTKYLKGSLKKEWSIDNPTRGYCYNVSEWLYHYIAPYGSKPYLLKVPNEEFNHRFIKWKDGTIIDLTVDQFDDYEMIQSLYPTAVKRNFMTMQPSKRTMILTRMIQES